MRAILPVLLIGAAAAATGQFRVSELEGGRYEVSEKGAPVFVYNAGMMLGEGAPADRRRCCYLHPVHAPNGVIVTDDFPRDHWHHRGIFWAWPVVSTGGETFDPWLIKGLQQRSVRVGHEAGQTNARLRAENGWYAGERLVAREFAEIEARPAREGRRELLFQLRFEAAGEPVLLRGEPAQQKGYGGFSVRFAPREATVIVTSGGREAKDSNMAPHAWVELQARYPAGGAALRIEDDPANPGYPNGWCLRHYGFLGVNFPGLKEYRLEAGRPLELRYKVVLAAIN